MKRQFLVAAIAIAPFVTIGCGGSSPSAAANDDAHDELRTPDDPRDSNPTNPTTTSLWLVATPKQCRSNPWEQPIEPASLLEGEPGLVDTYFKSKSITLSAIGFLERPPSSVPGIACAACQCARGDRLVVKAKTAVDAETLQRDHEFSPADIKTVRKEAISCNMNEWDPDRDTRGTAKDLGHWASSEGASVSFAGFVGTTEPFLACRACPCPRGDDAVAIPKADEDREKLVTRGFVPLE